ncbi:MAG: hypothetical protein JXR03_16560 [Cyclobacteriaceae bacterium]
MRISFWISVLFLVLSLAALSQKADYPNLYNVVWTSQSENAAGSMPVGGGDIGMNVWVEDNQLLIYAQRSGVHDEYNGFPKLGRVRIYTEPNIFDGATIFKQELVLSESSIEISAKHPKHGDLKFKIWADVMRPRVHVECESEIPITYYAQYESWRTQSRALSIGDQNEKDRWGWWDTGGWAKEVVLEPDHFKQEANKFSFWHVNPEEKLTSKNMYQMIGMEDDYGKFYDPLKDAVWGGQLEGSDITFDKKTFGKYGDTEYTGWRYKSNTLKKSLDLTMWFHNSHCGSGETWLNEIEKVKIEKSISNKRAWKENLEWWKRFWDRSYIVLNPDKDEKDSVWRAGRNYNLFRYMTALNAYGENPTMFNGGLLSTDPGFVAGRFPFHPDWRAWSGGNYTMQNQRWVYWPMIKWGDFEHMESQFNFLERTLEVGKRRLMKHYGLEGWVFEEVGTVYGLPMPMHYGFDTVYIERRQRQPWMEPGLSANWCTIHHHTAMLEFSFMILEYHRYSGRDISKWLPIVKGTIDFFDNYYRHKAKFNANYKEYDENGKLIIFPSSACESHYYVSNPVPDVAGLQAVVQGALELSSEWQDEFFGGSQNLKRIQKTIPDFHLDQIDGDTVIPPGKSVAYSWWKKTELYINYPMFPFNRIEIGDEEMEYVHNTYEHWDTWQTPKAWEIVDSWTNGNVAFARMGITEKAAALTLKTLDDGPFRFPSFWGPGYDWVPDHNWGGTGSVGLQEMLLQTLENRLMLMPSWPKDWDCDFKLFAPEETIVEGKIRSGKLQILEVSPENRKENVVAKKR